MDQSPTFMVSFNLNYFLKTLSPNIITLGVRASKYGIWENTTQFIASTDKVFCFFLSTEVSFVFFLLLDWG